MCIIYPVNKIIQILIKFKYKKVFEQTYEYTKNNIYRKINTVRVIKIFLEVYSMHFEFENTYSILFSFKIDGGKKNKT